jgi:hypothetical protein
MTGKLPIIAALVLFWLLVPAREAVSQVKFYTLVSERTIDRDQTFQVQYVIEGAKKIDDLESPVFTNFNVEEIFEIPNSSAALSLNSGENSYSRIAVLSPTKPGKFTIPGATAVINGRQMRSNDVVVTVRRGSLSSFPENPFEPEPVDDESELREGESIAEKIKSNFFLKADINKTECYVGEPLMAVYKACSRLNANSQVVRRPSLTGFSVVEMVDAYDNQPVIERINDKPFYVHLIRKVQLFPLQPGTFQLEGAEVESVVHFYRRNEENEYNELNSLSQRMDSDRAIVPRQLDHSLTLSTPPINVVVKSLPLEGQPQGFSGAVGEFQINVTMPERKIYQGEASRVRITIRGHGNFPLITEPVIEWPDNIEASEPVVTEQLNHYVYPLAGTKTFEYTILSNRDGQFEIPAVRFSYFDPSKKKYRSVTSNSVSFDVSAKKFNEPTVIASDTKPEKAEPSFERQWIWYTLVISLILAWLVYQIVSSVRSSKAKREPAPITELKVPEVVTEPDLQTVLHNSVRLGDDKSFYRDATVFLQRKLVTILNESVQQSSLRVALRQRNISEDFTSELTSAMHRYQLRLYTPETTDTDLQAEYDQLLSMIDRLQTQIQGKV